MTSSSFARMKKTSSILTLITFIATQNPVSFAAATTVSTPEVRAASAMQMVIPSELGTIEALRAGHGPAIIHIQTAHGNYEAQKNIQAILKTLRQDYGIKDLFLEGAMAKLDPSVIRYFPENMTKTMAINDELTKRGVLKGAELFLAESQDVAGYGIENRDAYKANAEAFKEVLTEQEKAQSFLDQMNIQIERLTSPYLSADLRAFLKRYDDFEAKKIPAGDWLTFLREQVKKQFETDIAHPIHQFEYPSLVRVYQLRKIEENFNPVQFQKERPAFLNAARAVPQDIYTQIEKLLQSTLTSIRLSDPETSELLEAMVKALPADFNYKAFPQVNLFLGHAVLQSEVKGALLGFELKRLADKITLDMTQTDKEREILGLLNDQRLLKKLFALELTPQDYQEVRSADSVERIADSKINSKTSTLNAKRYTLAPSNITQRLSALNDAKLVKDTAIDHVENLDRLFDTALAFYARVEDRDQHMLENIEKSLQETGAQKAVVITGGFHSGPFQNYFESKGYSYALIAPRVGVSDEKRLAAERKTYIQHIFAALPSAEPKASTIEELYVTDPSAPTGYRKVLLGQLPEIQVFDTAISKADLEAALGHVNLVTSQRVSGLTGERVLAYPQTPVLPAGRRIPANQPVRSEIRLSSTAEAMELPAVADLVSLLDQRRLGPTLELRGSDLYITISGPVPDAMSLPINDLSLFQKHLAAMRSIGGGIHFLSRSEVRGRYDKQLQVRMLQIALAVSLCGAGCVTTSQSNNKILGQSGHATKRVAKPTKILNDKDLREKVDGLVEHLLRVDSRKTDPAAISGLHLDVKRDYSPIYAAGRDFSHVDARAIPLVVEKYREKIRGGHFNADRLLKALMYISVRPNAAISANEIVSHLTKILEDTDSHLRAYAVRALGETELKEIIPTLIDASASDRDSKVRVAALAALGFPGAVEAIPTLMKVALESPSYNERRAAVSAIGKIKSETAVPFLLENLENYEKLGRLVTSEALEKMPVTVLSKEILLKQFSQPHTPDFLVSVVKKIAELKAREALPRMKELLMIDPNQIPPKALEEYSGLFHAILSASLEMKVNKELLPILRDKLRRFQPQSSRNWEEFSQMATFMLFIEFGDDKEDIDLLQEKLNNARRHPEKDVQSPFGGWDKLASEIHDFIRRAEESIQRLERRSIVPVRSEVRTDYFDTRGMEIWNYSQKTGGFLPVPLTNIVKKFRLSDITFNLLKLIPNEKNILWKVAAVYFRALKDRNGKITITKPGGGAASRMQKGELPEFVADAMQKQPDDFVDQDKLSEFQKEINEKHGGDWRTFVRSLDIKKADDLAKLKKLTQEAKALLPAARDANGTYFSFIGFHLLSVKQANDRFEQLGLGRPFIAQTMLNHKYYPQVIQNLARHRFFGLNVKVIDKNRQPLELTDESLARVYDVDHDDPESDLIIFNQPLVPRWAAGVAIIEKQWEKDKAALEKIQGIQTRLAEISQDPSQADAAAKLQEEAKTLKAALMMPNEAAYQYALKFAQANAGKPLRSPKSVSPGGHGWYHIAKLLTDEYRKTPAIVTAMRRNVEYDFVSNIDNMASLTDEFLLILGHMIKNKITFLLEASKKPSTERGSGGGAYIWTLVQGALQWVQLEYALIAASLGNNPETKQPVSPDFKTEDETALDQGENKVPVNNASMTHLLRQTYEGLLGKKRFDEALVAGLSGNSQPLEALAGPMQEALGAGLTLKPIKDPTVEGAGENDIVLTVIAENWMWDAQKGHANKDIAMTASIVEVEEGTAGVSEDGVRFDPLKDLLAYTHKIGMRVREAVFRRVAEGRQFEGFSAVARSEMRFVEGSVLAKISEGVLKVIRKFGTNGIRGTGFNVDELRRMTAATALELIAEWNKTNPGEPLPTIGVAVDPRPQGEEGFSAEHEKKMLYARTIAEVLAAYGFQVRFYNEPVGSGHMIATTSPDYPAEHRNYAVLDGTASHNEVVDPKENTLQFGLKVFKGNAPIMDDLAGRISNHINGNSKEGIAQLAEVPVLAFDEAVKQGRINIVEDPSLVEFERLNSVFPLAELGRLFREKFPNKRLALNTMNGGMSKLAVRLIEATGIPFKAFNTTFMNDPSMKDKVMGFVPDAAGNPVRFAPDPTRAHFRGKDYDAYMAEDPENTIALLVDGDADRLVLELLGEIIPNQIGPITKYYLWQILGDRNPDYVDARTVPTAYAMNLLNKALEVPEPIVTDVGSKNFVPFLKNLQVGLEESGHIAFRYKGQVFFDHPLALALLMLTMMAETGKTWRGLEDDMWTFITEKTGAPKIETMRTGISRDEGSEKYFDFLARLPKEEALRTEFAQAVAAEFQAQGFEGVTFAGFDTTAPGGVQLIFTPYTRAMPRKSGTDGSVRFYFEAPAGRQMDLLKKIGKPVMKKVLDGFLARSEVRTALADRARIRSQKVEKVLALLDELEGLLQDYAETLIGNIRLDLSESRISLEEAKERFRSFMSADGFASWPEAVKQKARELTDEFNRSEMRNEALEKLVANPASQVELAKLLPLLGLSDTAKAVAFLERLSVRTLQDFVNLVNQPNQAQILKIAYERQFSKGQVPSIEELVIAIIKQVRSEAPTASNAARSLNLSSLESLGVPARAIREIAGRLATSRQKTDFLVAVARPKSAVAAPGAAAAAATQQPVAAAKIAETAASFTVANFLEAPAAILALSPELQPQVLQQLAGILPAEFLSSAQQAAAPVNGAAVPTHVITPRVSPAAGRIERPRRPEVLATLPVPVTEDVRSEIRLPIITLPGVFETVPTVAVPNVPTTVTPAAFSGVPQTVRSEVRQDVLRSDANARLLKTFGVRAQFAAQRLAIEIAGGVRAFEKLAGRFYGTQKPAVTEALGQGTVEIVPDTVETITEALKLQFRDLETGEGAGQVLLDYPMVLKMATQNPRSFYLLLKSIAEIQESLGLKRPLLGLVADSKAVAEAYQTSASKTPLYAALTHRDTNLSASERETFQGLLDAFTSGRLVQMAAPEKGQTAAQLVEQLTEQNGFGVTALALEQSQTFSHVPATFVVDKLRGEDWVVAALLALRSSVLAAQIKSVTDPAERIQLINQFVEQNLPGVNRIGSTNYFVVENLAQLVNKLKAELAIRRAA